ncbi:unnamed protein product [Rotaria sordida]|uniref:Tetratricopeptide repeat protein n=1 Tax=Rotaria sordida TaxID=392033 RepID=A0A815VUD0_9BILA|nr:unnamed protein product [Rotaria sordida]CAF3684170.1 unnamed protein product [Rotaria sordida]
MNYNDDSKEKLVDFCRHQYYDSVSELKTIDEFDQEYHKHSPIWWYTRECFTYHMLNRALRTQDIEVIINMGFFLRDVHEQIRMLHAETSVSSIPSIVYRGQGMSKTETEILKTRKGGLLAFNSFLSTSVNRELSLLYAESAAQNSDLDGILFQISIDPTINVAPFTSVNEQSYYGDVEDEILFSMHTVFRIGDTKPLENEVLQIDLILTADDDPQLRILMDYLRQQDSDMPGWIRLANLLTDMGNFDKAEEIYQMQHRLISDGDVASFVEMYSILDDYFGFGDDLTAIGEEQRLLGNYSDAISSFKQALVMILKRMGMIYNAKKDYPNALSYFHQALEVEEKYVPLDESGLSATYDNLADVHTSLGEYSIAMSYLQKALVIEEKIIPQNNQSLCTIYNNIAALYERMGEYLTAISFLEKSLAIQEKTIPKDHRLLNFTYLQLVSVYKLIGHDEVASFYAQRIENVDLTHMNKYE